MPGDRLAFAIEIRREIDLVRVLGELLQLVDDLFLARKDLVGRRPVVLRVDAHAREERLLGLRLLVLLALAGRHGAGLRGGGSAGLRIDLLAGPAGREVTDVAHRGLHDEVPTQILVDRPGLGRRLDDDERLPHADSLLTPLVASTGILGFASTPIFGRSVAGIGCEALFLETVTSAPTPRRIIRLAQHPRWTARARLSGTRGQFPSKDGKKHGRWPSWGLSSTGNVRLLLTPSHGRMQRRAPPSHGPLPCG